MQDDRPGRIEFLPRQSDPDLAARFIAISMIVNSALYLTAVFTAGILRGNDMAWKLAILTFGLCYLAALIQAIPASARFAYILVTITVFTGAMAGLSLLVW